MASNPLIGTWRLASRENRNAEAGQGSYPLSEDATGYIMHNEDGYRFAPIMAPNRLRFAADGLLSVTKEEEARAEETCVSYCWRYYFLRDTVVHHGEMSLLPDWIGADQERLVDLGENPIHVGHATAVAWGLPADRSSDLAMHLNVGAVDSSLTRVRGRWIR